MEQQRKDTGHWRGVGSVLPVTARDYAAEHRRVLAEVVCALAGNRVMLHFQPVVAATGARHVAFHEGLMRVAARDGGILMPGEVLPHVAGTPLAARLDIATLEAALDALRAAPGLRLSINIAPETMGDPRWLDTLRRADAAMPGLAYRLIVEVTEHACLAGAHVARLLAALRDLGCNAALDDFGAGPTAFRYLREFRFDIIKIDGAFGRGLADSPDCQALVTAMVGIARHFEMLTVAEFIETEHDAACAAALGVDCLQGYHFARPTAQVPRGDLQLPV